MKSPASATTRKPPKQPPPHPTLPRRGDTPRSDDRSVAGEEDPGSADEELREHRPGRDGNSV